LLGVVEVWREADAGVRPVVAEDVAGDELATEALGVGGPDRDGAAAPRVLARRAHREARLLGDGDQMVGERERPLADLLRSHAGDDAIAGPAGVERRYVRRAGEEPPGGLGVTDRSGAEGDRILVRLPAGEAGVELLG